MTDLLVQALASLKDAISAVAIRLLPRLFCALLVIVIAWAVARSARWAARRATRAQWLERLLQRSGLFSGLVEPSLDESRRVVAGGIYWCVLIAGGALALGVLSDHFATRLASLILIRLPNLLLASGIILGAWWLGRYWARSVLIWMTNEGAPYPWRWAAAVKTGTVSAGIALASEFTGIATTLVRSTFLIVLAGGTFAVAYASLPLLRSHLAALFSADRGKAWEQPDDQLLR